MVGTGYNASKVFILILSYHLCKKIGILARLGYFFAVESQIYGIFHRFYRGRGTVLKPDTYKIILENINLDSLES